jgi:hypothetical protein
MMQTNHPLLDYGLRLWPEPTAIPVQAHQDVSASVHNQMFQSHAKEAIMLKQLAVVALLFTFCLAFQGCALLQSPPEDLVAKGDHAGLANFYQEQAQELREKAKTWDALAESYKRHSEPHGKVEPQQHAAHCGAVAVSYRKAADEADALATAHRQEISQGAIK